MMPVTKEVAVLKIATAMILSTLLTAGAASQPRPPADQHLTWAQTRTHPGDPKDTGSIVTHDEVLVDVIARRCSRFRDVRHSADRCVEAVSVPGR
jgi:hypothetical protein